MKLIFRSSKLFCEGICAGNFVRAKKKCGLDVTIVEYCMRNFGLATMKIVCWHQFAKQFLLRNATN